MKRTKPEFQRKLTEATEESRRAFDVDSRRNAAESARAAAQSLGKHLRNEEEEYYADKRLRSQDENERREEELQRLRSTYFATVSMSARLFENAGEPEEAVHGFEELLNAPKDSQQALGHTYLSLLREGSIADKHETEARALLGDDAYDRLHSEYHFARGNYHRAASLLPQNGSFPEYRNTLDIIVGNTKGVHDIGDDMIQENTTVEAEKFEEFYPVSGLDASIYQPN